VVGTVKLLMLVAAIFFGAMAVKNAVIDRDAVDAVLLTCSTVGCLISSILWGRVQR
jgi:hypothetical protein